MSLGLLGAYYSSSSESDEDCDNNDKSDEVKLAEEQTSQPKLANPFMKEASKSLKPSYMVQTEDLSASKQVIETRIFNENTNTMQIRISIKKVTRTFITFLEICL